MLHQIGNGALGPVFRAYDQDRDRLVAVKLFRLDLPPERVHQLVTEFEKLIAAELQHPVIAAPRATGIDNNNPYLAQDFAAADSLDIVLRESGAAPPGQAVRVVGQLAEALDYAAERQIVHGSLHPRDILVSQEDIRIVGLGVTRALERVGVTAPVRRPYAAPERINDGGWDRGADVFSLAAIAFELLSGKRVAGTGSEAAEALDEVPGADMEALQRVFALALAADPAYRYSTATAFTDALKDAMGIEIAPPKPKARRKPRLRVVSQEANVEPELPLNEVHEVQAGQQGPEVQDVPEVPDVVDVTEGAAVAEEPPLVKKARRRRAPAPTPVAIETVAAAEPEPELIIEPEPVVETVEEPAPEPELQLEPSPIAAEMPMEFAPVEEAAPEPIPDPQLFTQPEPEPERQLEPEPPIAPEPHIEQQPEIDPEPVSAPVYLESANFEPVNAEPVNVERLPAAASAQPLPVSAPEPRAAAIWPIGVAAVLGIAIVFGGGYMVAIRDKSIVPAPAAAPTVVQPAPPAKEFTEVTALPPPAPKAVAPEPAPPAEPAPAFQGRVLVRTVPSGARVFIDGQDRGQTPATIRELSPGAHRIRVERVGYAAVERRVTVTSKQPSQSLSIPLAKSKLSSTERATAAPASVGTPGSLVVESRPQGAAVLVDGRRVGTTPLTLSGVQAGRHDIRLEREGYRVWTAGANVSAGEQNRVTASLEK